MLSLTFGALLLVTSSFDPTTARLTTIALGPLDEYARLPNAVVFFLPKNSALSPVAADIVARAARNAGSGTIVMIEASSDHAAGETPQRAADRADVVRRELIRNGVPPSNIHIMHVDAFRAGIDGRRVIVSIISAPSNIPWLATIPAAPGSRL